MEACAAEHSIVRYLNECISPPEESASEEVLNTYTKQEAQILRLTVLPISSEILLHLGENILRKSPSER